MTGSSPLPRVILAALAGAGLMMLGACSPKSPSEPAVAASDAAPPSASDAASSQAAADAAISSAAAPAAGTVANDKGDNQKTIKPSVSISEEAEAGGDEAPQDLRAKVAAAKAAGRAPVLPKP